MDQARPNSIIGRVTRGVRAVLSSVGLAASSSSQPSASVWPFDAGRHSRIDLGFTPRAIGPNKAAEVGNLGLVRARSRAMLDNSPVVDGAVETLCDYVVGTGITIEPATGDEALDDQIRRAVAAGLERVDPERQMSLGESQALFVRELFAGGDVLAYYPQAKARGKFPLMPSVELIESERLPLGLTGPFESNQVRQGVEFDADGSTVAYHVLVRHPDDDSAFGGVMNRDDRGGMSGLRPGLGFGSGMVGMGGLGGLGDGRTVRIPAELAELAFVSRRAGQVRGVPRLVSSLTTARTEEGFTEDCLGQARLAASMGVFLATRNGPGTVLARQQAAGAGGAGGGGSGAVVGGGPGSLGSVVTDTLGRPVLEMGGPQINIIDKDTDVKTVSTNLGGPAYQPTSHGLLRKLGRALRIPTSTLTGDYAETSFSSLRGEQLDGRKSYKRLMKFVVDHHTAPLYVRLVAWALLTGRVTLTTEQALRVAAGTLDLFAYEPGLPGMEYSNPKQEAEANEIDLRTGVGSVQVMCAEKGLNWRSVLRQRVAYEAELVRLRRAAGLPDNGITAPAPQPQQSPQQDGGNEPDESDDDEPAPEPGRNRRAFERAFGIRHDSRLTTHDSRRPGARS